MVYARLSEDGGKGDQNDWLLTARVESSIKPDWKIKKRTESFLGKEGFGMMFGAGIGIKTDGDDNKDGETVFTADYLLHMNQLSALAEFTYMVKADEKTADGDDVFGTVFTAQAGWAMPKDDMIVEPVARLTYVKVASDGPDQYTGTGGASGMYVEGGVNLYLSGHKNKLGFHLTSYTPENDDGDAFIVRAQHQPQLLIS